MKIFKKNYFKANENLTYSCGDFPIDATIIVPFLVTILTIKCFTNQRFFIVKYS
jgi:hypothetical protein